MSLSITALGTTQATAQPIYSGSYQNRVTTCTSAANGVVLPGTVTGSVLDNSIIISYNVEYCIQNAGVSALLVYPPTNGVINALSANAAYSIPAGQIGKFVQTGPVQAYAQTICCGGVAPSLTNTALAGGAMSAAPAVGQFAHIFVVSTCATAYDSISLPRTPVLNVPYLIINQGAAACAVFPTNTIADASVIDSIASSAGSAGLITGAYPLAAGARVQFTAVSNTAGLVQWYSGAVVGRKLVVPVTAARTLTVQESGAIVRFTKGAAYAITLPSIATSLGCEFLIEQAGAGAAFTVTVDCSANGLIGGWINTVAGSLTGATTAGTHVQTISFLTNASVLGDQIKVVCDGTHWVANGMIGVAAGMSFS